VATASASYPLDLYDKVRKAMTMSGTKYIQIHIPCPPRWGFETRYTVKVGRLAVETGFSDLFEIDRGRFRLTAGSTRIKSLEQLRPVEEYLKTQVRFRLLKEPQIAEIQARVDAKWSQYLENGE
jgi:pyruvate ferredoxin oxidoreductase beta subunit